MARNCFPFFHNFTPWQRVTVDYGNNGETTEQIRRCQRCGREQRRAIGRW